MSEQAAKTAPAIILVRPRLPENIGMAARAMANMGARVLTLVSPLRWGGPHLEKAAAPATPKGLEILQAATICASLAEALAPVHLALGATARLSGAAAGHGGDGGWRNRVLTPAEAADELYAAGRQNLAAALVFGPEDTGLENAEIEQCSHLVNIPTFGLSSLNLAQAVLLLLYECSKSGAGNAEEMPERQNLRQVTLGEERMLLDSLRDGLARLEAIPADRAPWYMRSLRRFLRRRELRRHEFDLLMGLCRQLRHKLP
jgi:tRNA/rRNA methyltransferase